VTAVRRPARWIGRHVHDFDRAWSRIVGRRTVLVDARTPVNFAILAPVFTRLMRDPNLRVLASAARPAEASTRTFGSRISRVKTGARIAKLTGVRASTDRKSVV